MRALRAERGFSLVELLVSQGVLVVLLAIAATMLIQNTQINKAQQMTLALQADARNTVSMVVNALRTAGWDPTNAGFDSLGLDPDPNGSDNFIQIFADLNADGDTDDQDEEITVRHTTDRVEWRKVSDPNQPFVVMAENITNDQDDDGVIEPMFTPNSMTNPNRVSVRITARSAEPDPRTGQFIRYTVVTDVYLRDEL